MGPDKDTFDTILEYATSTSIWLHNWLSTWFWFRIPISAVPYGFYFRSTRTKRNGEKRFIDITSENDYVIKSVSKKYLHKHIQMLLTRIETKWPNKSKSRISRREKEVKTEEAGIQVGKM